MFFKRGIKLELWKKNLIDYMEKNNLSRKEMIILINKNGGNINNSGLTHWLNNSSRETNGFESRKSKPSPVNAIALKKIIGGNFDFETIYNGEKTKG
jgi:hypothetical protein